MEMKMSNENKSLLRTAEKSLQIKSLKDLVRARTSENSVLCIDVSYSMTATMRNGKTRIQGLREVVAGMRTKRADVQMIAFGLNSNRSLHDPTGLEPNMGSKQVDFVTEVPDAQGGTPMAEAIDLARTSGFGRAVVISDGGPNDQHAALEAARQFGGRIDVIYVGDAGDPGSRFLDELAKITGGQRFEGDLSEVKELTGAVVGLLNGESLEEDDDDDDDDDEEEEEDDDVEDAEEFDE
jgi:Mg-chelatase subunit ChlD